MKLAFATLAAFLASPIALPAEEVVIRGEPFCRDDFEHCTPAESVLKDESRPGCWNLRNKTWGGNNLLNGKPDAPDIAYNPRLKGFFDIEVESRATDHAGGFGLKLASEPEFTVLDVPNEGATPDKHFNVWMPFRKNVRLDDEKIILHATGKTAYIDSFRFTPVGRYERFRPLRAGEPGPSTGVICKEFGRYIGWPTIARTSKGELIATFSGDRDAHVCPWGKTQMVRSRDDGKTWSDVVTINNTPLDDRDSGIIETQKGTLLVSWFTSVYFEKAGWMHDLYRQHAAKLGAETRKEWLGAWVRRSEDGGKTWGTPSRTTACAPHGPVQLKDGRLLFVGTGGGPGPSDRIVVEESKDDGLTWQAIARIGSADTFFADEPHVVECANGRLVALFRNEHPDASQRFLGQSESDDGGRTWTMIHLLPMWGLPPHLIRLADGRLLVVYGHRREPFGQRACLSSDNGQTWGPEIVLVDAPDGDLGYPSSVQLGDGSILTVFYQKDKEDEKPCLMASHWRLPPVK